jgi:hypothetical protein
MGVAAIAQGLVGGVTSAIGGIMGATEQRNQLGQQAENEKYQAMINDHRAVVAQKAGETEAERRAKQIAIDLGSNRSAFAGNGLLLEADGTTGATEDATVAQGWQDIGIIKQNTAMNVWGFQTNAAQQRTSAAEMNRQGKRGVKSAKTFGVASSLFGGVSSIAGGAAAMAMAGRSSGTSGGSAVTYQPSGDLNTTLSTEGFNFGSD